MSYTIQTVSDKGRTWVGGKYAGQSAELVNEYKFDTLGQAIAEYEKFVDWGFAGWELTINLLDEAREVVASKTFHTPRG